MKTTKRNTVSLQKESLEQELLRVRQQEHAYLLAEQYQAVEQARQGFRLTPLTTLTPESCDALSEALHFLKQAVQATIAALDTPEMLAAHRPYAVLLKLWSLYRMLSEGQVLLAGVRGLCLAGRLMQDRTGCYWQTKQYVAEIGRSCGEVLRLLVREQDDAGRLARSA